MTGQLISIAIQAITNYEICVYITHITDQVNIIQIMNGYECNGKNIFMR